MTGTDEEFQKIIFNHNASDKEKYESLLLFCAHAINLLEKQEPLLTLLYHLIIKNNLGDTYDPKVIINIWTVIKQHIDAGKQIIALENNANSQASAAAGYQQNINEALQNDADIYEKFKQDCIDLEKSLISKIDEPLKFFKEFQKSVMKKTDLSQVCSISPRKKPAKPKPASQRK